jgi:hypothetical protein
MQQSNFRYFELFFPGETFRVLKEKEQRQYGEYRIRRLVLEAWEKFAQR